MEAGSALLLGLADELRAAASPGPAEDLEGAVRRALAAVSALPPASAYPRAVVVVRGGWAALPGHGVVHVIMREADATGADAPASPETDTGAAALHAELARRRYAFVTLNTGDGLHYHPGVRACPHPHDAGATKDLCARRFFRGRVARRSRF